MNVCLTCALVVAIWVIPLLTVSLLVILLRPEWELGWQLHLPVASPLIVKGIGTGFAINVCRAVIIDGVMAVYPLLNLLGNQLRQTEIGIQLRLLWRVPSYWLIRFMDTDIPLLLLSNLAVRGWLTFPQWVLPQAYHPQKEKKKLMNGLPHRLLHP